jgi:elongation factor P--(R)-beta-lysine ligase
MLHLRAQALAAARAFFCERHVLEVDTPLLVRHAVSDVNIHSAQVHLPGHDAPLFLHTSPEYAMKRLLAAGSGDIYQIAHVVRGDERGRWHNAEFTLIEWYRCGYTMSQMIDEVMQLARTLLALPESTPHRLLTYSQAFERALDCEPLTSSDTQVRELAIAHGLDPQVATRCKRDELLDWLMATAVGPRLGSGELCAVHRYPLSQASLARVDETDPRVALRFELYYQGVELANGFEELADAGEQRSRFQADLRERARRGLPQPAMDQWLLDALAAGLPSASGVAVGFDRLLMLRTGAREISEVLPFPLERA